MPFPRGALILTLAAILLMLPAALVLPGANDSAIFNHIWTKQFAGELARGELYPRWMPDSFEGLGSPTFYFYPPLAFYLSGLLALALPVQAAIAVAGAAFLLGSGLAMHAWLRDKTRHPVLLALLYMAAPYHLMDFYLRGSFAEFAGFAWLPLIALGIERLRAGPALLALAYAGLIMTHLPLAVLASIFLIAPLLLLRPFDGALLLRAAWALGTGLLLAAPYLAPALLLQGEIHREVLSSTGFDPAAWSIWRLAPGFTLLGSLVAILGFGWSALALGDLRASRIWFAMTLVAALCGLAVVPQIWSLPVLRDVQFPWRLLAIVEFAAITALAIRPPGKYALAVGATLVLAVYPPTLRATVELRRASLPAGLHAHMMDAVEYLPAGFHAALRPGFAPDLSSLRGPPVSGPVASTAVSPGGRVALEVAAPGRVTLRRSRFPSWRVVGPAGETPLLPGPLISFDAAPGHYEIAWAPPAAERIGWACGGLGALLLLLGWRGLPARARPRPGPHTGDARAAAR